MRIKEVLFDAKEPTVYCESFVYEPSNIEEERLGYLFMVGRIRNVSENSFYLINLLASRIKREYYENPRRSPSQAIESALKKGNNVLKENEERINWLGNLDFLVVAVSQRKIYLTCIGKIKAYIIREEKGEQRVIDLIKDLISERDVLFPFSIIITGTIKKNDILIFSTSNIFSKEKLLKFGKKLFPIRQERIEEIIQSKESGVALVVETGKTAEAIERLKSASPFIKRRFFQGISQFLTPSKKKIKADFQKLKEKIEGISPSLKQRVQTSLRKLFSKGIDTVQKLNKAEKKEQLPLSIPMERVKPSRINLKIFKKYLSKKKVAIVIFIVIFTITGFGIYQHRKNIETKTIEEMIKAAEEKKTEGENALIYGDKEKSLAMLTESLNLLNSIKEPKDKEERIKSLKKEIEDKINEITGRQILSDISPVFEIKKGIEEFNPEGISIIKNNIYIFSPSSSLIYKWDLSKKEGFFLPQKERVIGTTVVNGKLLLLLENSKIAVEDSILSIKSPYENLSVREISHFRNYFYLFDKNKGEIIKYKLSNKEVSNPILWFKEREEGKGAVSMAIDGSIYLLFPEGKIKRYTIGSLKEEIDPPETFPKIKNATKIFTSKDNKYLYLIEPFQKRVIVIKKTGEIVKEYQSEQFKNLKDIWATPQDKTIYLLSENKIFKIELPLP